MSPLRNLSVDFDIFLSLISSIPPSFPSSLGPHVKLGKHKNFLISEGAFRARLSDSRLFIYLIFKLMLNYVSIVKKCREPPKIHVAKLLFPANWFPVKEKPFLLDEISFEYYPAANLMKFDIIKITKLKLDN